MRINRFNNKKQEIEMTKASTPLFPRSKVWLQDAEGNVIFGAGRLRILKAIKRSGSIHAAAKELKIGYRAVWARIHATEERLGVKLLEKKIGGASGGGSELTPLAEFLIEQYTIIQNKIEKQTDELFQECLGERLNLRVS
jgi:molybdate transport system regulatory protein